MADLGRHGDYPMADWDPFRIMRAMMRWDPFRATAALLPKLDRDTWMPQFEVRANGTSLRILADMPGVKREELEISVDGNRLLVSGRREAEQRGKDENVHTYERQFGQFSRTFTLPDNVDHDHITSELRDGVLTIVVPMRAETKPRRIQIGGTSAKS